MELGGFLEGPSLVQTIATPTKGKKIKGKKNSLKPYTDKLKQTKGTSRPRQRS